MSQSLNLSTKKRITRTTKLILCYEQPYAMSQIKVYCTRALMYSQALMSRELLGSELHHLGLHEIGFPWYLGHNIFCKSFQHSSVTA